MARHDVADAMLMDSATQRNLELITSLRDGGREGTLLSVMDRTYTPMGARFMRQAITRPLVSTEAVLARQEAVGELHEEHGARDEFAGLLKSMGDLERLAARVGSERANARDLIALKAALHVIPVIKEKLSGLKAGFSAGLRDGLQELRPLAEKLDRALVDDPPLSLTEGGLIRAGYNEDLDDLRVISSGGKRWIAELQQKERERTGIQSLKVDYNRVFGYYIEVTKPNLHRLEGEYIRKQTMRNAERFITPELKEYEEKILGAEEKIGELEYTLFLELREEVAASLGEIQGNARAIAQLDFLTALAELAVQNDYVAPEIVDGPVLEIDDGRHPVVEQLLQGEALRAQRYAARHPNETNRPDHRAEHGRQEHLSPPGGPHRPHGPDRFLRPCALREDRHRGPHLHPRGCLRQPGPGREHLPRRDERDREHPQQRDAEQPRPPRRNRPGHEHLRRA